MLGILLLPTPSYRQSYAQMNLKSANQCQKTPIFTGILQSALGVVGCQSPSRI
jgi:hypothetical protein